MKTIKEMIQKSILDLRMKHSQLTTHQDILIPDNKESLRYAVLELQKAWTELKIAILCALIGEDK